MHKNIKIFFLFLIVISFIILCLNNTYSFSYNNKFNNYKEDDKVTFYEQLVEHYNKYVKTVKKTNLYDERFNKIGYISEGQELKLDDINFNEKTKHFKITLNNAIYYLDYYNLIKIDNIKIDKRYKNYIPYNENIVTNDVTSFYNERNEIVYIINKSFNLPIIIKEKDKYGVEFNDQILYINKNNVIKTIESNNTNINNIDGIPVLNYHFVYEDGDTSCKQTICHSSSQIEKHFSYIKDNNIFTPTMKELEMYIDAKLQLPKSVVLTFDDGTRAEIAKKYIDKYQLNATLFIVTSRFKTFDQFKSDYTELHSHSDNMHNVGVCPTGQGGGIQCLDSDIILKDLKLSREKLNNTTVFCYPFFEYNERSIKLLKEAGFTMAFGGEYEGGKTKVQVGIDKYRLPRWVIVNYTTMNQFVNYVNGLN